MNASDFKALLEWIAARTGLTVDEAGSAAGRYADTGPPQEGGHWRISWQGTTYRIPATDPWPPVIPPVL